MVDYPLCEVRSHGLKIEMTHPNIDDSYVLISVYGSDGEADKMKTVFIDVARACDSGLTEDEISSAFDANCGAESRISLGVLRYVVFSAPTDAGDAWRIDVATEVFLRDGFRVSICMLPALF